MPNKALACVAALLIAGTLGLAAQRATSDYLQWSAAQADALAKATYKKGRVGGFWDARLLKTERAYNYKLAATWLTPEVIRATARAMQLRSHLSDDDTRALVREAERPGQTVIMIEIDPREGSGVIPDDWQAVLQPIGRPSAAVRGTPAPQLRDVKALAGVLRRNYDYDRFWVVFTLHDPTGAPLFAAGDPGAELIVRIYEKEGRVVWPIPPGLVATR